MNISKNKFFNVILRILINQKKKLKKIRYFNFNLEKKCRKKQFIEILEIF